jgi:hypothetical protein
MMMIVRRYGQPLHVQHATRDTKTIKVRLDGWTGTVVGGNYRQWTS